MTYLFISHLSNMCLNFLGVDNESYLEGVG